MPYFIKKQDDQYCVLKGTEEDPGEVVKCYPTRNEAMGHMRALYANVEDTDKASVSPTVGSLIHGSGGILNPMRDGKDEDKDENEKKIACECPKCGRKSTGTAECSARKCPECGVEMQPVESKATWDSAYVSSLPNSAFLYVEPSDEDETPKGKRHLPYRNAEGEIDLPHLRNAISRLGQSATGGGKDSWLTEDLRKKLLAKARRLLKQAGGGSDDSDDEKSLSQFTVYKSDDHWRWLAISNVAVQDREGETISRKAYDDAIAYANENICGELDMVHVDGTDIGVCDFMYRLDDRLIEGGYWLDDERAKRARVAVQADPDYWGVSIKFQYDPSQFDGSVYHGGIRILKRSVLPRHMAASYGTAIAVSGGERVMKMIDEETKDALRKLQVSDEEIATLAENQKATEEPNIKAKDETKVDVEIKEPPTKGFLADIAKAVTKWFTDEENAETEIESPAPVENKVDTTAEPAAAEQSQVTDKEVEPEIAAKSFAELVVKSVAELVAPLQETITQQAQTLSVFEKRLAEAEKDVETKVLARIESLPPVAKVRTSEVASTVTQDAAVGLANASPNQVKSFVAKLMEDITTEVAHKVDSGQYKL